MITAQVAVLRDGKAGHDHVSGKVVLPQEQPADDRGRHSAGHRAGHLLVLGNYEAKSQTAFLELWVTPLVNWIWIGFAIIAIGTLIALMPDTLFAFAYAKIPAEAVTTVLLLLALGLAPAVTFAESPPAEAQRQALTNRLEGRIMCTCGGAAGRSTTAT